MPHTRSAAKRYRQSEDRRVLNKDRLTEIKTLKKRILRAVHDGEKDQAATLYASFSQRADQAASKNTMHPNAVARAKSRLSQVIAGKRKSILDIGAKAKTKPRATTAATAAATATAPAAKAPAKKTAEKAAKKPKA